MAPSAARDTHGNDEVNDGRGSSQQDLQEFFEELSSEVQREETRAQGLADAADLIGYDMKEVRARTNEGDETVEQPNGLAGDPGVLCLENAVETQEAVRTRQVARGSGVSRFFDDQAAASDVDISEDASESPGSLRAFINDEPLESEDSSTSQHALRKEGSGDDAAGPTLRTNINVSAPASSCARTGATAASYRKDQPLTRPNRKRRIAGASQEGGIATDGDLGADANEQAARAVRARAALSSARQIRKRPAAAPQELGQSLSELPSGEKSGLRRPARQPRMNRQCCGKGIPAMKCIFSIQRPGEPAQGVHEEKGHSPLCVFCDTNKLTAPLPPGRCKHITRSLKAFLSKGRRDVFDQALSRLPEESRDDFAKKALQLPRRQSTGELEGRLADLRTHWESLVRVRKQISAEPSEKDSKRYREQARDDKRRAQKKFAPVYEARQEEDESWRSSTATAFERWCHIGSWLQCETCHRLEKRPLGEVDIGGRRQKATVKKCRYCKDKIGYPTVQKSDIPEPLQGMSKEVLWALRPLEPFTGRWAQAQHGYRIHTDMIRFWWRPQTVREQISHLRSSALRQQARAAYEYLMASPDSAYEDFVELHCKFLRRNAEILSGSADDYRLQLPRRCLEEVGLECAVWPHLYPYTKMCETYVRSQDMRRREREKSKTGKEPRRRQAGRNLSRNAPPPPRDAEPQPWRRQHWLSMKPHYENMVWWGSKTVEGRIKKGPAARIAVGDEVMLGSTKKLVIEVLTFADFAEMLRTVGVQRALPDCSSVAEGVAVYHSFANYATDAARYGVVAFILGDADNRCNHRRQAPGHDERGESPDSSLSSDKSESGDSDSEEDGDPENDAAPLDFARAGRNSAKASYLAKILGPVLDYSADFELFQFNYDLWLWSALGSKKNTKECQGTPLRLTMAGHTFSPEYWRTRREP